MSKKRKKNWTVVRLHDESHEPIFVFGPMTKRDARDLARSEDWASDISLHFVLKLKRGADLKEMLKLARLRGEKRREQEQLKEQSESTLARM